MSQPCAQCGSPDVDHACPGDSARMVGTVLDGRYQVESILGQGGMGTVYRALQTSMRREVAIKTLHPSLATAPQFFERFRREAELASNLRHPNIITIFDFGRAADGTCYFVMELLHGKSVRQLVREEGLMSLRRAVDIIEQAALGLGHAHAQGIVHRDVKPHNILVGQLGGFDDVKLLDFGLVKALEQEDDDQLTSTGQVLGTPQYMPPEQAGGEAVDARSDVYSLGGVLYYCLTGQSPFGANTVRKALQASLTQPLAPVGEKRSGTAPVPPALDAFLKRTLAAEMDDRPPSAEAFIEELQAAIGGCSDAELDARPEGLPTTSEGAGGSSSASRPGARRAGARRATSGLGGAPARPGPPVPSDAHAKPSAVHAAPGVAFPRVVTRSNARAGEAPGGGGVPKWLWVAAPAALVLLGGGAWLLLAPAPAPRPVPTPPPQPVVASPAPLPAVVAPVVPSPAAAGDPSPVQPLPVPTRPAAAPASALVTVHLVSTPPAAEVFDGEALLGTTPLDLRLERDRTHALSFRKDGYAEQKRALELGKLATDTLEVSVTLAQAARPAPPRPTQPASPKKEKDITLFE